MEQLILKMGYFSDATSDRDPTSDFEMSTRYVCENLTYYCYLIIKYIFAGLH
jgi:hypothetical protein